MPATASIVINDSVPAAHTFAPSSSDAAVTEWQDRAPGTPAGFLTLRHEVKKPAAKDGAYRVLISGNFPQLQTVSGITTVANYSSVSISFNFSKDATLLNRKDVLAYVKNFLANANVTASVENVEAFW